MLRGIDYTVAKDAVVGNLYDNGGFLFDMLGAGGDRDDNAPGAIRGAVYTFTPNDMGEVLARLDRLEGYRGPARRDNLYRRVVVRTGNGERAWVYEVPPGRQRYVQATLPLIHGGSWLERAEQRQEWGYELCP